MLIYAGIDEAGYGPMFGPLCVACTVFTLEPDEPAAKAPNLWTLLKKSVCRSRSDSKRRIAVDDSKKLKGANDGNVHPLKHLERGVLAFLAAHHGECPGLDDELLRLLGAIADSKPWYQSNTTLPVAHTADELRIAAAVLRRTLEQAKIQCPCIAVEAIDAEALNAQSSAMGSKAAVNLCAAMRHVDRVWSTWRDHDVHIAVDRQGGRAHYLRPLQLCYPDAQLTILDEDETISRYRLEQGRARLTISFTVEAERHHLPVALASMTAKYTRELLMLRLNRFFRTHMPELKPTAGYYQDGVRFLDEIAGIVGQLGLNREHLVRNV